MYCAPFQILTMTGSAYARYHDSDDIGGGYSSDSDLGHLSAGEETDDASESESYNHQVGGELVPTVLQKAIKSLLRV